MIIKLSLSLLKHGYIAIPYDINDIVNIWHDCYIYADVRPSALCTPIDILPTSCIPTVDHPVTRFTVNEHILGPKHEPEEFIEDACSLATVLCLNSQLSSLVYDKGFSYALRTVPTTEFDLFTRVYTRNESSMIPCAHWADKHLPKMHDDRKIVAYLPYLHRNRVFTLSR